MCAYQGNPSISRLLQMQQDQQKMIEQTKNMSIDEQNARTVLINLWHVLESRMFQSIAYWDNESFHISDPYLFERHVLKLFKTNDINDIFKVLFMCGFGKITHVSHGCHVHLEFSHPFFKKGRFDLLSQIKIQIPTGFIPDSSTPPPQPPQTNHIILTPIKS